MSAYRIRDWNKYENNRTRDMKVMQWIATPVKLDGNGYCAIMELEDGPAIYGCWMAILQVSSRCEPRGTLIRGNGESHDFKTLARLTRIPKELMRRAIFVLSGGVDPDIDWLEEITEKTEGAEIPQEGAEISQEGAVKVPYITLHNNTVQDICDNAREQISQNLPAPTTMTEEQARQLSYSHIPEKEQFVNHGLMHWGHKGLSREEWEEIYAGYQASGWRKNNGQAIHNWKSDMQYHADRAKERRIKLTQKQTAEEKKADRQEELAKRIFENFEREANAKLVSGGI